MSIKAEGWGVIRAVGAQRRSQIQALRRGLHRSFSGSSPFKLRLGGCGGIGCEKCRNAFQVVEILCKNLEAESAW